MQTTFTGLLKQFNGLVENMPNPKTIEKELKAISTTAKISSELNYRQKDAITARVDHYLNGTYGKKDQEFKAHKQS